MIFKLSKPRIECVNLYVILQRRDPESCSLPFIYYTAANIASLAPTVKEHDERMTAFNSNVEWDTYSKARADIDDMDTCLIDELETKYSEVIAKRHTDGKALQEYLQETITVELRQIPMSHFPGDYNKADFISLTALIDPEH